MAPDVRKPRSLFENVPADGHHGCQLEETRTSVRRRFLGSSSDKSVLTYLKWACRRKRAIGVTRFCVAVWRTWSITTVLDRLRLRELTVSPAILIWQRLVHLFRV